MFIHIELVHAQWKSTFKKEKISKPRYLDINVHNMYLIEKKNKNWALVYYDAIYILKIDLKINIKQLNQLIN